MSTDFLCAARLLSLTIVVLLAGQILPCSMPTAVAQQKRRVDLTVVADPGVGPLAPSKWMERLKKLPLNSVRISTGSGDEQASIDRSSATIRVTGVLRNASTLQLPGARFSLRDQSRLATWFANLASGKGDEPERLAFGLTSEQLLAVHQSLSNRTTIKTKGVDTTEVLDELVRDVTPRVVFASAAKAALQDPFPVADELRGLSHGATLAALLRPVGLIVYPTDGGRSLTIDAVDTNDNRESWPIGWPLQGQLRETTPSLFRKTEIGFDNVELHLVLDALQQRMKMPIVLDQNGMARKEITIEDVRVSLPEGRTYYKRALDRAVSQAKLRAEVRVDEAENPFIWLSPRSIRRAP